MMSGRNSIDFKQFDRHLVRVSSKSRFVFKLILAAAMWTGIAVSAKAQLSPGTTTQTDGVIVADPNSANGGGTGDDGLSGGTTVNSGGDGVLVGDPLSANGGGSGVVTISAGSTVNPGTTYNDLGFGTYNLSGGSVSLDGSSVFGGGTSIVWDAPSSGGTLEFEPTLLTATDGNLSLTGDPVTITAPFTLSSGGSLEIDDENENSTVGTFGAVFVLNGQTSLPQSSDGVILDAQSVPEPSSWSLSIIAMSLLVLFVRRKAAKTGI
jgi:hypothetical protein